VCEREEGERKEGRREDELHTHASGCDALGNLGAESLREGNVTFFKDSVEELCVKKGMC